MEAITFSTLPAEIHVGIARYYKNHDLINLCLVSKLLNERCLYLLYRHVDLQCGRRDGLGGTNNREYIHFIAQDAVKRARFLHTLTIHPEYGKDVRILEKTVFVAEYDNYWGPAMRSLTHVQHVDLNFENFAMFPQKQFPFRLFESVTSMRLVGQIQFSLAKSILNGINPATLNHLCLDLVPDLRIGRPPRRFVPQDNGENARIIAFATVLGLLTPLTGRFTALRTLILRRVARIKDSFSWYRAAEEESYAEWASFIRSVKGTVERFMFEQVVDLQHPSPLTPALPPWFEILDEKFQWLVLPTIVSGNWPCLERIELRSIRNSRGQGELARELRAVLGGNATIVVKGKPQSVQDYQMPYRWS